MVTTTYSRQHASAAITPHHGGSKRRDAGLSIKDIPSLPKAISLLAARVAKGDGCWNWRDGKSGYGSINLGNGRWVSAHRLSYVVYHGDIPDGMCVCHRCDNRNCIRPDHLFLGDHKTNMADMATKGRAGNRGDENAFRRNPELARRARSLRRTLEQTGDANPNTKLSDAAVCEVRARRQQGETVHRLASEFGVSASLISKICLGKRRCV